MKRFDRFRPRIAHKLILAFLGLTLLLLLVTLGLARWSFQRGFQDYTNALEQERLQRIAASVEAHYLAAGGSWERLSAEGFRRMRAEHAPPHPPSWNPQASRPPPFPEPPFAEPPFDVRPRRRPPPGMPPPDWHTNEPRALPSANAGRMPGSRGLPPRPTTRFGPQTALFDADGRQLAGDTLEGTDGEPVRVALHADGSRIGELRSIARRRFETPQATAFARQQWQASLAIALVALVMATLVSWWLARALLAPLRRTIDGVTELANGDYSLRLNERRDDELGTLMDGLNRLAEALEKNQSARRRWLADIAHELRTPVTILAGELEALKDGIREPDPAQLESLDQEVQRLRRLVDDLNTLSLSDLGGLRYTFTELDLAGRLDQALGPVRIRAAERGLDLEVDLEDAAGSLIRADPTRIDQLLTNLFENALAYTEAPGRIAIRLRRDGDALLLSVCDSPPGVAADDCERIFEPLYRQDGSRSRRTAGAGLGLAICRNIVEAHRGEISAAPSPFGGLCIQVTFPALNRTLR